MSKIGNTIGNTIGMNAMETNQLRMMVQGLQQENNQLRAALQNKGIMEQLLFAALTGATSSVVLNHAGLLASKDGETDSKKRNQIMTEVGIKCAELAFCAASATFEMLTQDRQAEEDALKKSEEAKPSEESAELAPK